MFTKEESAQLRKLFWVSYGKSFPRKWILYNTKIKDFSFKFMADRKQAGVCLDIENNNDAQRELLFEQVYSLNKVIESEYLPEIIFDKDFYLDNGKLISRIYVLFDNKFSIHNKNTWGDCYQFFNKVMPKFEEFWLEYEDYIKQAVVK